MFEGIIVSVVISALISFFMAPKPIVSPDAVKEDFSVPETQDGSSIPIIFGTVYIDAANIAWYGDVDTKPIK